MPTPPHARTAALVTALTLAGAPTGAADRPHGFPAHTTWIADFAFADELPAVGDFDGDGLSDLATFLRGGRGGSQHGDVHVATNFDDGFFPGETWIENFCTGTQLPLVGDFNGDSIDDIACLQNSGGGSVTVALSWAFQFAPPTIWIGGVATGGQPVVAGDFDGDGDDDLAEFDPDTGYVHVALSRGFAFHPKAAWLTHLDRGQPGTTVVAGDFDRDGRCDIAALVPTSPTTAEVLVARSTGSGFTPPTRWLPEILLDHTHTAFAADFDADGTDDLATVSAGGALWVATSTGSAFTFDPASVVWNPDIRDGGERCLPGHFNRDLNADLAVFTLGAKTGPPAGDVHVSLAGDHALSKKNLPPETGYATMGTGILPPGGQGGGATTTEVPLLLGVFDFGDRPTFGRAPQNLRRDAAFFEELAFGPSTPNMVDWFLEMSRGKFTFSRAGVVNVAMDEAPDSVPDPAQPGKTIDMRWLMVERLAAQGFDFRPFDTDGDGEIHPHELCILLISNNDDVGGQAIAGGTFWLDIDYPSGPKALLRTSVATADHLARIDLIAHELTHILGTFDFYSSNCYNDRATLMHCNANYGTMDSTLVHLDPYHKLRLGWVEPVAYDVRDGPGFMRLDAAQAPGADILLLYDGSRAPGEYYLFDYRSPWYDLGTVAWQPVDPPGSGTAAPDIRYRAPAIPPFGYPGAGYDSNVRKGVHPWYCRMEHPTKIDEEFSKIRPGPDGVLDTPVLGDDVLAPLDNGFVAGGSGQMIIAGPDGVFQSDPGFKISPGPDGTLQSVLDSRDVRVGDEIHAGPDLELQSARAGDDIRYKPDTLGHDWIGFLSTDPRDTANRGSSANILSTGAGATLGWRDRGSDVRVRAGDQANTHAYIQWGRAFRPFISGWPLFPHPAGTPLTLTGKFGYRMPVENVTAEFRSRTSGHVYTPRILSWDPGIVTVEVPGSMPSDSYDLYFSARGAPDPVVVSNTVPFDIEDAFLNWRWGMFFQDDVFDPTVSGPVADVDLDDLSTLAEYVHGGDPYQPDPHLLPVIEPHGDGLRVVFPVAPEHPGVVLEVGTSRDLTGWTFHPYTRFPADPEKNTPGPAGLALDPQDPPPFVQLRYTLIEP